MVKLQQFLIAKFNSSLIVNEGYNLKRSLQELQLNNELVSLGDSQLLRHIRTLTSHPYTPALLSSLLKEVSEAPTKSHKISSLLFIPEYITIKFDKKSHYKSIIKNFTLNGISYTRAICGAGMARVSTVGFVATPLFKPLYSLITNSYDPAFKISPHKFNAYLGLASSATHVVSTPNPLLINDYEEILTHTLDFIVPNPDSPNGESIGPAPTPFEQNFFDGCGMIHPTLAQKWAEELGINYIPSYFIVRAPFVKGAIFTIDFHDFPHSSKIKDYYGLPVDIHEHNLVLTKSMFKLADAYPNMQTYMSLTAENKNHWGITRVAPKADSNFVSTNYQFLQALNINPDDIPALCQPTIDYITQSSTSQTHALIYLLQSLTTANTPNLSNIPPITKALILCPDLINDPYIQYTLKQSLNKKILQSYIGKLFFHGNYSIMIPDLYAFMQHLYDVPVTGYIKPHQCCAPFYEPGTNLTLMRAPLTWRSECNAAVTIAPHPLFIYQTGGIMYCAYDDSIIRHADSDWDGDIVFSSDNWILFKSIYTEYLPISYEKLALGQKKKINPTQLYKADLDTFDSQIGTITNYSTAMYALLAEFPEGSPQYLELIDRLKLTRKHQGNQIDRAKGVKVDPYPSHWIKTSAPSRKNRLRLISPRTKFNNTIAVTKKPYFMIYRYPKLKREFALHSDTCAALGIEQSLVIDSPCVVNNICHYLEKELAEFARPAIPNLTPFSILLMRNPCYKPSQQDIAAFIALYKQYASHKKTKTSYSHLIPQALSLPHAGDLAVYYAYVLSHKSYLSFIWEVFAQAIIQNLFSKMQCIPSLPMTSTSPTITHAFKNYALTPLTPSQLSSLIEFKLPRMEADNDNFQ